MGKKAWGAWLAAGVLLLSAGCSTARIAISTDPSDAAVTVDGVYIGDSPVVYKVTDKDSDQGKAYVRAAKEGYQPKMEIVTKDPNWPERVNIVLQRIELKSDVNVKVHPETGTDVQVAPK